MTHTAAHELGHVLGLGDSGMAEGFMGPLFAGSASSTASSQEVQALLSYFDRADLLLARAQSARLRGL
jgi:predicted Zn-dependent protease